MPLTRRQKLALRRSNRTINLWYGAVRSSKTYASLWAILRDMSTWEGQGAVLIIGKSTNTVWRNIFIPLLTKKEFAAVAPHIKYRQNAASGTIFGKPFYVVGASNDMSWQAIQGMTVWRAHGDEAATWPRSFWDMLLSRLSLPDSRLIATCNPSTSNHYLKTEVVDKAKVDPDIHVEKFLLEENSTLSRAYIDRLYRMYKGLWKRRMIDAEWVAAEGAVYEGWEPATMTTARVPEIVETIAVGLDYGTQHPTAGYALGVGVDGKLYITDEWSPNLKRGTHTRLTDSQLADSLQDWLEQLPHQPMFIYADPAAASFREELKARGLVTYRADNKVLDGIRTVDNLLVSGALVINRQAKQLIDEVPNYRWDPKATEKGVDAPIKEKDDHVDALRYTVHSSRHIWRRLINHDVP